MKKKRYVFQTEEERNGKMFEKYHWFTTIKRRSNPKRFLVPTTCFINFLICYHVLKS